MALGGTGTGGGGGGGRRMVRRAIFAAGVGHCLTGAADAALRRTLADGGAASRRARLSWPADNGTVAVAVVRADLAACALRVVDAHRGRSGAGAHAADVCPRHGAAINAGFFSDAALLTPVGLVIAGGTCVHTQHVDDGWGLLLYRRGRVEILPGNARLPARVTEAVECKPRLVIQGTIPTFKPQGATRRSAVGLDNHGHLFFAATDGELTLDAWAACLHDGLGCRNALNMDGGPSTQLAVNGKINYVLPGPRMPVLLTLAPRGGGK